MTPSSCRIAVPRLALVIPLLLVCFGAPAGAERLAVRTFSTADGLGSSFVNHVVQDSAGYIWFATRDGLSRWNGYEFVTLAQAAGFPIPALEFVTQVRSGEYFVVGNDGSLYSYLPPRAAGGANSGQVAFRRRTVRFDGKDVHFTRLYQDSQGILWGGGHGVVVKGIGTTETPIALDHPSPPLDALIVVNALLEDRKGSLWIAANRGLFRRLPDGRICHFSLAPHSERDGVGALALDAAGRLWIGHSWLGVVVLNPADADSALPSQRLVIRSVAGETPRVAPAEGEAIVLTRDNGLPGNAVFALLATTGGDIWIGTGTGLARYDGTSISRYTRENGLGDNLIHALCEDGDGNLWAATPTGAMRLALDGFSGFTAAEGLGDDHIVSIGETPGGAVYAIGIDWSVNMFDGRRFRASRPPLPKGSSLMWASQAGYRDREGRWWALTHEGLYRFSSSPTREAASFPPADRVYTTRDGLPSSQAFRLYQDRSGTLWVGTRSGDPLDDGLARFDATLTRATALREADGLPARVAPSAFAEDRRGDLWVGFYHGGLARYRNGRFTTYAAGDGIPEGMVTSLLLDRDGRLWIATNLSGIGRVDDPSADRPRVRSYSTRDGLSSNNVRALTQDREGRIFAGTVRGVDRLDPATGLVRHYGPEDGLLGDFVTSAFCDSRGDLWFGTYRGAFRLGAGRERVEALPPILVTGIRVGGHAYPVLELGQTSVADIVLDHDQRDVQVEFLSVSRHRAGQVAYQYSVDAGHRSWSAPTAARSVNFARLPPGSYEFAVRAISGGWQVSRSPATVAFTIRPPVWRRWWAMALAACALAAGAFALYRYRVGRLLEVQRLRMGIASDLHDEVATNLSSIAMFSTLVKGEFGQPSPFLDRITALATESLDAVRDIVWSIDSKPETVATLLERLRDSMVTSCRARGIQLTVIVPSDGLQQNLTPEQRKNLWLMLKEAVTNTVKHSRATSLSVTVTPAGKQVRFTVRDNGGGPPTGAPPARDAAGGKGLATMRARASSLGGTFAFTSEPGHGTTVEFVIPLGT